jgi:hypothetical protein
MPAHPAQRFYRLLLSSLSPRAALRQTLNRAGAFSIQWVHHMAQTQVKLSVTFAWWLKPYIYLLAICAVLAGATPDRDKLARVVKTATRVKVQ